MEREHGFSLVELLFIMALMGILMTMGAFAARQFWFQRSLTGGHDQVVTQLRALQQKVVAEGVTTRYQGAWFAVGDDDWGTVRYDASTTPGTCTSTGEFRFDAGVVVSQVDFFEDASGVDFADPPGTSPIERCQALSNIPGSADLVFFLARGTATESRADLILEQPRLDDRSESIRVLGLTGRVEKL